MRMNRRNVLVGLGTIVASGGAALGTGAFSSVEANRTVSVNTAGDADAYLGISIGSAYAADSDTSDNVIQIDLGSSTSNNGTGFNDNAETVLNGVLILTNQGENQIDVGFGSGSASGTTSVTLDDAEVTFDLGGVQTLIPGDSATATVTVNTNTGDGSTTDANITIYASDSS